MARCTCVANDCYERQYLDDGRHFVECPTLQPKVSTSASKPTRNSVVLASFVRYCQEHPDERFWQALRNWSGYTLIEAITVSFRPVEGKTYGEAFRMEHDTFNWEGRNGKEI
jgi:hypothetical protein